MALTTYAELQTTVVQRMERAGASGVSDMFADSVVLCEERVNLVPDLRVREMETEPAAITLTSGSGTLPTDFIAMKAVVANTGTVIGLDYTDPSTYKREIASFTGTNDSYPFYTIIGSTIRSSASATLSIIYYQRIPHLSGAANWLLTKAPSVYLYGVSLELAIAIEGDVDKYGNLFAGAIQGLVNSETFNRGGTLTKRPSSQVA